MATTYDEICTAWKQYSDAYFLAVYGSAAERGGAVRAVKEALIKTVGVPADAIAEELAPEHLGGWWPATLTVTLRCHPGVPQADQSVNLLLVTRRYADGWHVRLAGDTTSLPIAEADRFAEGVAQKLLHLFDARRLDGPPATKVIGFELPEPRRP
jgi:hypothetical protein